MPHASRITRYQVLAAALRIADRAGPASITMRRVADEVDVTPMALYHHVRDRQELLLGMVERLLTEVPDAAGHSWQDRLRSHFLELRHTAVAHPKVFPLVIHHPPSDQLRRIRLSGAAAMVDAGVPRGHVARTEAVVWTIQFGFVTREALGTFRDQPPGGADRDAAAVLALVEHYVAWVIEDPERAHSVDLDTDDDHSECNW